MAHAADVDRSIAFYSRLGFTCQSRFSGPDGLTNWADLRCGAARLMLARASGKVPAAEQAVLFYLYTPDVQAFRSYAQKQYLQSAMSKSWLPGMLDKINAL